LCERRSDFALFIDWKNAASLNQNESDWLLCYGKPVAAKCASIFRWDCRKRRRKNSPCTVRVEVVTDDSDLLSPNLNRDLSRKEGLRGPPRPEELKWQPLGGVRTVARHADGRLGGMWIRHVLEGIPEAAVVLFKTKLK
jgi:hypothetical protein